MCIIIIKISSREDGQKKKVEEPARQSKPPAKKTNKSITNRTIFVLYFRVFQFWY